VAKQSGLGDNLYIGGFDVSGDTGSIGSIHGGPNPLDVTCIDKLATERLGGVRTGGITWSSFFDNAALAGHPALSTLPTADAQIMYCRGTTLGNPGAAMVAKQIGYDPTRAADGSLTFAVDAQSNGYGLEWGIQHTAGKRTDTAATNGTSVDAGSGSTFGLQAYLQVFSFTGTSVTVTLQESSDNAVGDPFANVTGGSFAAATGQTTERIVTSNAQTVERYLRVVTTGTFSSAVFAVLVVRNPIAGQVF